jgi:acyl carrier protein
MKFEEKPADAVTADSMSADSMTERQTQLVTQVLACANKAAGTSLTLNGGEDLPLEAFRLDSLSLFAFMVEVEQTCGINFDEVLQNYQHLQTIRSTAAFIASRTANGAGS